MEYVHATLLLHETGREINEANLTAVLEAADVPVTRSRLKAIVAALEGVDIDGIDPVLDPDAIDDDEWPGPVTADGTAEHPTEGVDVAPVRSDPETGVDETVDDALGDSNEGDAPEDSNEGDTLEDSNEGDTLEGSDERGPSGETDESGSDPIEEDDFENHGAG